MMISLHVARVRRKGRATKRRMTAYTVTDDGSTASTRGEAYESVEHKALKAVVTRSQMLEHRLRGAERHSMRCGRFTSVRARRHCKRASGISIIVAYSTASYIKSVQTQDHAVS